MRRDTGEGVVERRRQRLLRMIADFFFLFCYPPRFVPEKHKPVFESSLKQRPPQYVQNRIPHFFVQNFSQFNNRALVLMVFNIREIRHAQRTTSSGDDKDVYEHAKAI